MSHSGRYYADEDDDSGDEEGSVPLTHDELISRFCELTQASVDEVR